MLKNTFLIGILMTVIFTSCRKNDLQSNEMSQEQQVRLKPEDSWKTAASWNANPNENASGFDAQFEDAQLQPGVLQNGLVLVFMKKGIKVVSLPYTEKGENKIYWHYQVSENKIQINADAASIEGINQSQFKYFVLSEEKIKALEHAGHSKIDLMLLNYDKAVGLLK
ncbi:MAG: hypothetical protein H0U44_11055 [Flavisolibacter sp.]|nr:hypothetical protein [Flavisolibacter sp.]